MIVGAKYDNSIMNDVHTNYPDQHCQPPCKSCTADYILFEKERDFCTAFVSATNQPTWESAHEV